MMKYSQPKQNPFYICQPNSLEHWVKRSNFMNELPYGGGNNICYTYRRKMSMARLDEKRIMAGDVYLNLVDGKEYTVSSVENGIVTFESGDTISVKKMETCFEFMKRGGKFVATEKDFEVKDGKFYYLGEEVKSSYIFEEVFGVYKDSVLLKVANSKENTHLICMYSPIRDRFSFYRFEGTTIEMVMENPIPVFIFNVEMDDGMVKSFICSFDSDDRIYTFDTDDKWICNQGLYKLIPDTNRNGIQLFFKSNMMNVMDNKDDEDAETHYHQKETDKEYMVQLWLHCDVPANEELGIEEVYSLQYVSSIETLKVVDVVSHYDLSYVMKTDEGIVYCNPSISPRYFKGEEVLKAYDEHPHFVKAKVGRHHNVLYLANGDYDVIKVHCELTDDRGYITEVVPVTEAE